MRLVLILTAFLSALGTIGSAPATVSATQAIVQAATPAPIIERRAGATINTRAARSVPAAKLVARSVAVVVRPLIVDRLRI